MSKLKLEGESGRGNASWKGIALARAPSDDFVMGMPSIYSKKEEAEWYGLKRGVVAQSPQEWWGVDNRKKDCHVEDGVNIRSALRKDDASGKLMRTIVLLQTTYHVECEGIWNNINSVAFFDRNGNLIASAPAGVRGAESLEGQMRMFIRQSGVAAELDREFSELIASARQQNSQS